MPSTLPRPERAVMWDWRGENMGNKEVSGGLSETRSESR